MFSLRSIRVKTLLWALVPTAMVLTATALIALYAYERSARDVVEQRDTELARVSAARMAQGMEQYTRLLEGLAAGLDPQAAGPFLDQTLEAARAQANIFDAGVVLYDSDGVPLSSYSPNDQRATMGFPDPAMLEQVRSTLRPAFSNLLEDPVSSEQVILITVPLVGAGGQLEGALAGMFTTRFSLVGITFVEVLEIKAGTEGFGYLVDGEGRVIYHRDRSQLGADLSHILPVARVLQGENGAVVADDPAGQKVISGFAPVPGTGWSIVTQERWDNVIGPIRGYNKLIIGLLASGGLLTAGLIFLGTSLILRPIKDLTRGARRISGGDFDHTIVSKSGDEFQTLAQQFNTMALALKESYSRLEGMVEARTKELQESEERFRGLVENAADAIFVIGPGGRVVDVNRRASEDLDYTREELLSLSTRAIVGTLDDAEIERINAELRTGTASTLDAPIRRKDGTTFPAEVRLGSIELAGKPHLIALVRDVTERKRAEKALAESEQKYRAVFDGSKDAIYITTREGRVVNANQATLDLFGYTLEEVMRLNTAEVYADPEGRARFQREIEERGSVQDYEARMRRKDGTDLITLINATVRLDENGEVLGYQGILRDVTVQRRMDQQLKTTLQEKEGLLEELAQLYKQEQKRAGQMRAINEIAAQASSILSLEELLSYVAGVLLETFRYYSVDIHTKEAGSDHLVLMAASRQYGPEAPLGLTIPLRGRSIVASVARTGEVLVANDVSKEPRFLHLEHLPDIRSVLAVPIALGDQVLGVLDAKSTERSAFDETDQATLCTMANQLAVAIENTRLFQQTGEVAVLEERNRMAREIHDTLAQGFTGIVLQLEAGEQALGEDTAEAQDHLERAKKLARESLQEARRSVWDLVPKALEERTLEAALSETVHQFDDEARWKSTFSILGAKRELESGIQAALLRICQESLTNARRHSKATEVKVDLVFHTKSISMVIEDNGVGFDPDTARNGDGRSGFGITGMIQRARLLGGNLGITSEAGSGTRIEVEVPTA